VSRVLSCIRFAPLAFTLACSPGPIAWSDSALRVPDFEIEREKGPAFTGACGDSAEVVWGGGPGRPDPLTYVAWWRLRADSSADLVISTSRDEKAWSAPLVLDSADASRVGCRRPPPDITVEGANVHVVYSMKAKEGPGVFVSHSMDAGRTFHSPVAVVYGERPARASIWSSGSFVVVAFEDPNTTPTRISVAVSNTMGHLFEFREVISPQDVAASDPLVSLTGRRVVLGWRRAGERKRVWVEGTIR
jgi:hypothetical protein